MAIKVSQATIDKIKKMGMTKALAGAKSANPEMKEALTRMYGARRVAAAAPMAAVPSTRRKYGTPNKTSKPVMVDAKGPNAVGKKEEPSTRRKYGTPNKTSSMTPKKSTTTDPFAKAVFGGLGALGRTLSVEPRVTAAQAKKNLEAKKRAAANKNK
jgi:hypothetical protein